MVKFEGVDIQRRRGMKTGVNYISKNLKVQTIQVLLPIEIRHKGTNDLYQLEEKYRNIWQT